MARERSLSRRLWFAEKWRRPSPFLCFEEWNWVSDRLATEVRTEAAKWIVNSVDVGLWYECSAWWWKLLARKKCSSSRCRGICFKQCGTGLAHEHRLMALSFPIHHMGNDYVWWCRDLNSLCWDGTSLCTTENVGKSDEWQLLKASTEVQLIKNSFITGCKSGFVSILWSACQTPKR